MGVIAAAVVGFTVGMLIGVAMVWDRRFNEGRRYGYSQGYESRGDHDLQSRLRGLM